MTYPMTVAGLQRDLPICKVTDDLYIGAFIVFGDAERSESTRQNSSHIRRSRMPSSA